MHEKVVARMGECHFVGVIVMDMGAGGAGGRLTAAEADSVQIIGMVTQADGAHVVQSLMQLEIAEIRLTEDATNITLVDGWVIKGRSTYLMNGMKRTVVDAM